MLTYGQLVERAAANVEVLRDEAYTRITLKRLAQQAYKEMWDAELWDELADDPFVYTLAANTNVLILPKRYSVILRAYNENTGQPIKLLDSLSFADQAFTTGPVQTRTSGFDALNELSSLPVSSQPVHTGILTIVSSAADTNIVWLRGLLSNGERNSEARTLTGTTPVSTTASYATLEAFSKTLIPTVGIIMLKDSDGNVIATLGRWESTSVYRRYQINGASAQASSLRLICKKAFAPFQNDYDYPFTEIDVPLVHLVTSLAWIEHRQLDLAAAERALYEKALNKLRKREMNDDNVILMVPAFRA